MFIEIELRDNDDIESSNIIVASPKRVAPDLIVQLYNIEKKYNNVFLLTIVSKRRFSISTVVSGLVVARRRSRVPRFRLSDNGLTEKHARNKKNDRARFRVFH